MCKKIATRHPAFFLSTLLQIRIQTEFEDGHPETLYWPEFQPIR
jgi:hypothetical protein